MALMLAASASACISLPVGRRTPDQGGPAGPRELPPGMVAERVQWASKKVYEKIEPNVLVAADRTRCTVSVETYRETTIGESVRCAWGGDK